MHAHYFALEIDGARELPQGWPAMFDRILAARGHRVEVVEIARHHQTRQEIEVGRWVIVGEEKAH